MPQKAVQRKIEKILRLHPELVVIFQSGVSVDEKRDRLRLFLSHQLAATFDDNPSIPPLEWVVARNSINAFRSILSRRSEQLAGFSFLSYLDALYAGETGEHPAPSSGFFAELEHLLRGVTGLANLYQEKYPLFSRYQGRRAAQIRSADLSRMSRAMDQFRQRYVDGLDADVVRRRQQNKKRILSFFKTSPPSWSDWRWHMSHIIRDVETLQQLIRLSADEKEAVRLALGRKIPFGITPYYLSLMDYSGSERDRAVRAQVIPSMHYVEAMSRHRENRDQSMDFMLERDTSPVEGITRRYPGIAILKPVMTCPQICVYCQRNWQIENVCSQKAALARDKLDQAISWLERTPEVKEVLVTGGDPLLLSIESLRKMLGRIARIPHVERIRIGTRIPVTLPQRITDSLVAAVATYHQPGRREVLFVSHYEHGYEVTPESMRAVQKIRQAGMDVYNQMVFTFYNSRKFEAANLRNLLRLIGVTPYYTFNPKGKEETDDFRVPIARLLQEQQEEARLMPGTVRTDEIVFNVPRLGKNYLRAMQHHDLLSILPNGRRVYEFHPWEKYLALVDTYVSTDVSIHDYLKRLKAIGENTRDYRTIWYYY